jgi:hypothetical protein
MCHVTRYSRCCKLMDDAGGSQLARRLNEVLFKKDHLDLDDTACALDKAVQSSRRLGVICAARRVERFICIWGG